MPQSLLRPTTLWRIVAVAFLVEALLVFTYGKYGQNTVPMAYHTLRTGHVGNDSSHYMEAAEATFRSGDHLIYPRLFFAQHEKYLYPPTAILLTEALQHMPPKTWFFILAICWAGVVALGPLLWKQMRGRITVLEALGLCLLAVLSYPNAVAINDGQVQLLITCLFGVSLLLWTLGYRACAGALLALTCVFKPQLGIIVVWALARRQWRFASAASATLLVIGIFSVARFGLQNHLDYLKVLSYLSHHGEAYSANQSMNGVLNRLVGNGYAQVWRENLYPPFHPVVYWGSIAFSVLCVAIGFWLPRRDRWEGTTADLLFFSCISVLASPIA